MAKKTIPPEPQQPQATAPATEAPRPAVVQDVHDDDAKRRLEELNTPRQAANLAVRRDDTMATAFQGLVPSSLGEAMLLSQHLARSKAIPKALQGEPESIFTIIMAGMEIGLTPLRSVHNISNISGTLCQKADLQLALVRRSGSLAFFNEGFEIKNQTDLNLADKLGASGDPLAADVADLIIGLTESLPDDKPYGWCTVQRAGDSQRHTRVFSWADAERFTYTEWDNTPGAVRGAKTTSKLSEKSNYVNTPQDMYPKRARVRVLQVTHSDVLAGMPAIEAMDGVVVDGQVISSEPATSSEDAITELIGAIAETDANLALSIRHGFDQLQLGIAKRLQLLRKYDDTPADLLEWLKTEYANRTSKAGRARPDVLGQPATEQPKAAATEQPKPANQQPPQPPTPDRDPGREVKEGGMEQLKSVAERFKTNLRTI